MNDSVYHLVSDDYDENARLEQDTQAALHAMAYRSSSVDFPLNDEEREVVKSRARTLSLVNRKKSSMDVEHPAALLNSDEPEVTVRGMVIGSLVGGVVGAQNVYFAFKLGWSMGISTTSAILGFALMSFYTKTSWGSKLPFGPKENCCIQTAAVAAASMSSASGLAVGLFALTTQFQEYENGSAYGGAKTYNMTWSEQLFWCYGILLFGFFVAIPLRRQLVVKYKLPFPSGQATAYVMRAMHTTKDGTAEGWIQFRMLMKSLIPCSIWYTCKTYMYSGLDSIPFFGMKAIQYYWYSDLSTAFIGCGIMIGSRFSISWFLGAIVGWAIIIPYVDQHKAGVWFDGPNDDPKYSLMQISGPFGYILFPAIAMMLIDSIYEISKIFYRVYQDQQEKKKMNSQNLLSGDNPEEEEDITPEKDIGKKIWIPGMVLFMLLGCLVGYLIFPHVTFPQLLVASVIGPLGATGILYGQGLTDTGMGVVFSKLAIMILCVWNPDSYIAPLVGGCLVYTCLSQAGDLMQDFKTAYLIGASPRSMLLSQVIGAISAPWWAIAAYHLYTSSSDIPSQEFPCLSSVSWLGLVQVFTEGFDALPKNCLYFVLVGSVAAISLKILEDKLDEKYHKWIPSVMPFTIGMYSTPQFAIDVLIGLIIRQLWMRRNRDGFDKSYAIICAGLIAGEGVTSLLIAMLQAFSGKTAWLGATWGVYE